jgi:hypothetical protein
LRGWDLASCAASQGGARAPRKDHQRIDPESARFKFHYGHGLNSAFVARALSSILSISYPLGSGA